MRYSTLPRRTKRYNRKRIGIFLFFLFFLGYFIFSWVKCLIIGSLVKTVVAQPGEVVLTAPGEVLVVRNEQLLLAPLHGKVKLLVKDQEKVRANTVVAQVSSEEANQQLDAQLEEAKQKIVAFDQQAQQKLAPLRTRQTEIQEEINGKLTAYQQAVEASDFSLAQQLKGELDKLSAMRQEVLEQINRTEVELDKARLELQQAQQATENALSAVACQVRVANPGVVSFQYDGLEQTLSLDGIKQLTVSEVTKLAGTNTIVRDGQAIEAGQPIGKLVDNVHVYLYLVLDQPTLDEIAQRYKLALRIPEIDSREEMEAEILKAIPADDGGKGAVILALNNFPEQLLNMRKTKIEVITHRFHGVMLPAGALINKEGTPGVFRNDAGRVAFCPVNVLKQTADQVIVDGLELGMEIITNPRWVKEGQALN